MYSFNGKVQLKGFPTSVVVSIDSFIFGGSTIQGVPWVFALVVYTGFETRL
jgi:hypothetical protein